MTLVFLALALLHELMSLFAHFCITPFGVAVRGKAPLKIACIGHSVYSGNCNDQLGNVFLSLALLT